MTSIKQEPDITVSSQPFEPSLAMKKRKTNHNNSTPSRQLPPTFEEELKHLNDDMDVDIKRKLHFRGSSCQLLLLTFFM